MDIQVALTSPEPTLRQQCPPKAGSSPMYIVHVAKHCGYGNGSVHVAVDLACEQAMAGHRVCFVSEGGTFVPMLQDHGVRHVTMVQQQGKPLTMLATAARLTRFCQQDKPTVLHAHMMGGAVVGYVASRLTGIPLVTTVHNSFDWHSFLMRLGDRVVAVSEAERTHLLARGYSADRVDTIWNAPAASPRDTFMRNERSFAIARPNVMAICALHRRKGVFDLIEACRMAFQDFPEWRLYIAGEGPDREDLERQVAALGLSDRVTFLGFVPSPRTLFEQADIFVLASYADPGSLSIGEARAAGCAIIATSVGGTAEMLEHGAAGRLVAPGSPRQIAVALRALMASPQLRADLSRAAQAGSDIFQAHRLVGDYEQIYRKAIQGRRTSSSTG